MDPKQKAALPVYGLGIFVVLLCWAAVTAYQCGTTDGHWYVFYCAASK